MWGIMVEVVGWLGCGALRVRGFSFFLFFFFLFWGGGFSVVVGEWFVKCVETFHLVVVSKRPVFVFRALTVFWVSG